MICTMKTMLHLLCVFTICWARPNGAPQSACSSLMPSHAQIPPQSFDPPYTISAVKNGDKVRITVSSPSGEEFEGFVVQARSSNDRSRIVEGTFTTSPDSKTINCFDGKKNTLTHVDPDPKTEIISEWTPSSNIHEDVVFRATVAKTFSLFWTEIDSSPVRIQTKSSLTSSSQFEGMDVNYIYDGCFSTKGCFGYESGCVNQGNCDVLLTFTKKEYGIFFTLHGHLDPQRYMAFGLSEDNLMGEDSVTECIRDVDGSTVYIRTSYNEGKKNIPTQNIPRYESSFSNGLTTCSWFSPFLIQANGRTYNLFNSTYYALLATGPMRNERLAYHAGKIASSQSINFSSVEAVEEFHYYNLEDEDETEEITTLLYSSTILYETSSEYASTQNSTTITSEKNETHAEKSTDSNNSSPLRFNYVFLLALCEFMIYATGRNLIVNLY